MSTRDARNEYCPGVTPRRVNAPLASVNVVATPSGSVELALGELGARSLTVSCDIGPVGPLITPDTRTVGENRSGRSATVRCSPDASVISMASAGVDVPGR